MLEMFKKVANASAVTIFILLIIVPLWLALDRLIWVAGPDVTNWFSALNENYISKEVVGFTFLQATLSTVLTVFIGLPIAWQLGRYEWPFQSFIKSILTMPFVMPSIVAAIGFLNLMEIYDLRSNENTWFTILILAHAWFNLSLVIRFCEPVLSTLDPRLEEQIKLLPNGQSFLDRIKHFWAPLLLPSVAAAACMTFVFSFTSFALVKLITLGENTIESMMASIGSSAGIEGYQVSRNEIILGGSIIQFTVLLISLWLMSYLQQKRQSLLPKASERIVKKRSRYGWFVVGPAILFAIAPLLAILVDSFRVQTREQNDVTESWSTEGWEYAFKETTSLSSGWDALINSLSYAFVTLAIALPLGWILAQTIKDLEVKSPKLARIIDVTTMLPFAVSSVMIGLGVTIGMIKINPEFFYQLWFTPVIAHVMITTPFVVRIILPALRSIEPAYDECAMTLGVTPFKRLISIKIPMLRGSIIIAAIFTLAMSMGEFGASWVVTRNSDWTTLPIMIDTIREAYKPITNTASNAIASVLMLIALVLFTWAEKFRPKRDGGMF